MTRRIEYTTKFRKDFKRYLNQPAKKQKILATIKLLADGLEIPSVMRPHKLIGNYAGCMELHIEGDLLLIWMELLDDEVELIRLIRLGSHSDLF